MMATFAAKGRALGRAIAASVLGAAMLAGVASAEPRHGLSAFGELKYPAGFAHFDYVNPDAPKGGTIRTQGTLRVNTFDSFNGFILKGDPAQGLGYLDPLQEGGHIFDTLMVRAKDEPDAVYGLIAETAEVAPDGLSVTFVLRPEARFHDGSPITADDVVWTLEALKTKGHPRYVSQYSDVTSAVAIDARTVRFDFETAGRDLPLVVATMPVLSKAHYAQNDFERADLTPPLGSGPYRIADWSQGQFVVYERVADYWGADLPVNIGRFNFDEIRYEYFRDRDIAFEAFKAGQLDLREEFTSKTWATEYDFPAINQGLVIKEILPAQRPDGQGFYLNTRRPPLTDPRVREALGYAFDFEWTNATLFYGLYERTHSFFENSDLKAEGPPTPGEQALLGKHADKLAGRDFSGPAFVPPVTDGSGRIRRQARAARALLQDAGWTIQDGRAVNADGTPLELEMLYYSPTFERVFQPFRQNLEQIGITLNLRLVDPAQYEQRLKSFDFDITTNRTVWPNTPGVGLRTAFGGAWADVEGSSNLSGIADPLVDALLDDVEAAQSRADLQAAVRALDRVLRAGHYWVPHWYKGSHSVAYWDRFGRPAVKPDYARGIIETWWIDPEKDAALAAKRGG